jgi:hypothetical protein
MTVSGTPTLIYRFWYGNPIVKVFKKGTFGKIGLKKFHWINFNAEELNLSGRINLVKSIPNKLK